MFNKDKLFEMMKSKGYTNNKMANALNNMGIKITADAFKQYKAGKSKPRMEVFEGIVEVLNVLEQELFDISPNREKLLTQKNEKISDNIVNLPLLFAGDSSEILNKFNQCSKIIIDKSIIANLSNKNSLIAVKITGDEMEKEFKENDITIVELIRSQNFIKSSGLYLVDFGNILQIRKVQFITENEIILITLNKDYTPINIKRGKKNYKIVGKVVAKLETKYYSPLINKPKKNIENTLLVS